MRQGQDGILTMALGVNFLTFAIQLKTPSATVLAEIKRCAFNQLTSTTMRKMCRLLSSTKPCEYLRAALEMERFRNVNACELDHSGPHQGTVRVS
ncbi:hypothetical protein XEUV455_23150, partial [Xanthomonas euvesicatoria]